MNSFFRRRRREADLDRELHSDLQLEAEERRAAGLSPAEAQNAARRALGNEAFVKEEVRIMWGWQWLDALKQDLCYAARGMRKSPAFTATAVLSLALGIGANTAIFSVLNAVELRRLPVRDPERLVMVEWSANSRPNWAGMSSYSGCDADRLQAVSKGCSFSYPAFDYLRAGSKTLAGVTALAGPAGIQARILGGIVPASAQFVSGNYFPLLGVRAQLGRTLDESDDAAGAPAVAVLSARYWEARFQSDPGVVGRTIPLQGAPFTIVGVAERGFFGLQGSSLPDLWIPVHAGVVLGDGWWHEMSLSNVWLYIVGRLRDGASAEQARAEIGALLPQAPGWAEAFGRGAEARAEVVGIARGLSGLRRIYSDRLHVLMAVAGVVLLIACANIANLLLTRASARRREIAVRLAIGCSRGRLIRQLSTESALLAFLGTAVGVALGWWTSRTLAGFLSGREGYRLLIDVRPDPLVLAFTLAAGCVAALLFGLAPAVFGSRGHAAGALKTTMASAQRSRFGRVLAALEMALALVLLVGAGLFVRTLIDLETLDAGFQRDHLLTFEVSRPHDATGGEPPAPVNGALRERLAALPGVLSATWGSEMLLIGNLESGTVKLEGRGGMGDLPADTLRIGPGFFETMGIPVLEGRGVREADCRKDADAIWVNRRFVAKYAAGDNLLGGVVLREKNRYTITGVVGDTKYQTLRSEIKPTAYIPSAGGGVYVLRTAADPMTLAGAVRQAVREVNPNLLVDRVTSEAAAVENELFTERMMARFSAAFGVLALAMAAIGIYGVLAFSVARRTAEIAIRISLGARPRGILRMVLGDGLVTALIGAEAGLAASWGLAKFVASMLFGVKPLDAFTYAAATLLLLAVALAACYVPARRAMRVDPMMALRHE